MKTFSFKVYPEIISDARKYTHANSRSQSRGKQKKKENWKLLNNAEKKVLHRKKSFLAFVFQF